MLYEFGQHGIVPEQDQVYRVGYSEQDEYVFGDDSRRFFARLQENTEWNQVAHNAYEYEQRAHVYIYQVDEWAVKFWLWLVRKGLARF